MFGVDDLILILVATTVVNLAIEIGVEVVAEWVVNSPDSPMAVPGGDPASQQIPNDLLTQVSMQVGETAGHVADRVSLKANELSTMFGESLVWSEQMIGTLGSTLGL